MEIVAGLLEYAEYRGRISTEANLVSIHPPYDDWQTYTYAVNGTGWSISDLASGDLVAQYEQYIWESGCLPRARSSCVFSDAQPRFFPAGRLKAKMPVKIRDIVASPPLAYLQSLARAARAKANAGIPLPAGSCWSAFLKTPRHMHVTRNSPVSAHDTSEPNRRDFLYVATGMAGVVGAAGAIWPFIDQMQPDASMRALSSIEVDVSSLEPGMSLVAKWRGKPVFSSATAPTRKWKRQRRSSLTG